MRGGAILGAVAAFVLFPGAAAHADERQTIATFSGGLSAIGPLDPHGSVGGPEDIALQLRAIISWEDAPPPYKEPKGYVFNGTVVPEIFAGTLVAGDDRVELIGGGLRLEAAFSQRRMGLLQVSMRGGVYVAGRGGLFTDAEHTPFFEGAFGEYILLSDTTRVGIELGIMSIRTSGVDDDIRPVGGGALYGPPFRQGEGSYLNVNAAFYLGVAL